MRLVPIPSPASPAVALTGAMLVLALSLPQAACDPVHGDAVAALGPEADGVRQGPLHRPGQPCILCHDGALGDPQRFTIAGTIFETTGQRTAAAATVELVDATGATTQLTTNEAGNFYATPGQYDPTFPLQVTVLGAGGQTVRMQTLVNGNGTLEPNGSCASCHFDPAGPSSPGHVAIMLDDGGTPP